MIVKLGTDGARGEYISPEAGYQVGRAAVEVLGLVHYVMVQDTRLFNPELAEGLNQGLAEAGGQVLDLGILPTSAAAIVASLLTREGQVAWGAISLSASHNPATDYGIKVFGADGKKLDDNTSDRLEYVANQIHPKLSVFQGSLETSPALREFYRQRYIDYLVSTRWPTLDKDFLLGTRIILDGANGAAFWSAQTALRELGADVLAINCDPNEEINKNCGTSHPEVIKAGAEQAKRLGFAFDGDADRLVTSTSQGRELDGDHSIHIGMLALKILGELTVPQFVSTKYSNLGLRYSLAQHGISAIEVINGDREVAQAMGSVVPIGGERSGHTLYNDVANRTNRILSGDGTATAIQLLSAVAQTGRRLEELAIPQLFPLLEKKLLGLHGNVFTTDKYLAAKALVDAAQAEEGDNLGRLSGTEEGVGRLLVRDTDPDRAYWAFNELETATQS